MSTSRTFRNSFGDCAGIVVCGGTSSRMGTDKAQLPIGGESMLQRIVRCLGSVVSPVVVAAAVDQALPELREDIIVVRDEEPQRGPLEGIRVGLNALPQTRHYAFITACDTPLLHESLVARLLSLRRDYDLIIPRDGDHWYPLTAVYHRHVVNSVQTLLHEPRSGPLDLVGRVRALPVDVSHLRAVDPHLASFQNINTPADYQRIVPS